ncbi:MAG: hypothetical protein MUO67_21620, partial [Anaerolineales bacterium]|nr:hypothetical protein [Anaerolineales bacterium]
GFMAPEEGGLIKGAGGLRVEVGDGGIHPDGFEDACAGCGGTGDEVGREVGFQMGDQRAVGVVYTYGTKTGVIAHLDTEDAFIRTVVL